MEIRKSTLEQNEPLPMADLLGMYQLMREDGSLKHGCIFSEPQIFQESDPMFSENFETKKEKK